MAAGTVERRLSAILTLDIAGYSRLMARNEEETHRRVHALMHRVVAPAVEAARGRVVKLLGDGVLAEFPAASEAIACSLAIQARAEADAARSDAESAIRLRIGINLGDVIVDGDDIYGDGVNIAARLEAIAEPGMVYVSEAAVQAADRTRFRFQDLGNRDLRNIGRAIRTFRALPADAPDTLPTPTLLGRVPGFGDRPAIAVLPLQNLSPDPEREYLADGLTEDIITELSSWRIFPVIARNSVFAYKGKHADLRTIGSQLGARYVLDGALRPVGKRLRITTQLNDVDTGQTLFAERYCTARGY
jgi:adenylate cyclase